MKKKLYFKILKFWRGDQKYDAWFQECSDAVVNVAGTS